MNHKLKVLETKYQEGFWEEKNSNYTSIWNTPIAMKEEDYRNEISTYFHKITKYQPKFIL